MTTKSKVKEEHWFVTMCNTPGMRGMLLLLILDLYVTVALFVFGLPEAAWVTGNFGPFVGLGYGFIYYRRHQ